MYHSPRSSAALLPVWTAFFLVLWLVLGLQAAQAQPARATTYADALPMGSGRSVPLPEGRWELSQSTRLARNGYDWEVFVLKNTVPEAAVPMMVVRQSSQAVKWGDTACNTDKTNPNQFLVNTHNTLSTQIVNKCSRLFALDNFERWMQSKPIQESEYWKESLVGMVEPGRPRNQGVFLAEMRITAFNSLGTEITLFINAPKGRAPSALREDDKAGVVRPQLEILRNWMSIYVEQVEQAFLNKAPQKLIALQFPAETRVASAPAPAPAPAPILAPAQASGSAPPPVIDVQTLGNNRPNRNSGAVALLNEVASLGKTPPSSATPAPVTVTTAATAPATSGPQASPAIAAAPAGTGASAEAAKMDTERKAIEKEKRELAEQLEKMQQMLAQLQKANADAAKAAQVTQAAQAAQAASAAALAAASTPAKPAVPQVFANRKALVIGNDLYTDVSKLNNAGADAEAMAKALAEVGYQVTKHLNVSEKAFKVALRDFRAKVQGGDEVLFFYAGHGVQLANANYLLPVDIKGDSEEQIKDDAIQLQRFLEDMQDKKTKFALAVIDACRDNPFKGQGRAIGGRGLAPTTAATGQMVMFSAGSGQQALDKLGPKDPDKNGLFTRIFVKEMRKPGVSVDRVLRNVRNQVVEQAKSVGHEQTPALYDQSIGEFYFLN